MSRPRVEMEKQHDFSLESVGLTATSVHCIIVLPSYRGLPDDSACRPGDDDPWAAAICPTRPGTSTSALLRI